ncbi:TetR/AcrR family transcriptional regulator [Streptomyces sp. NPDC088766]|uniref:TetR/AcrR family transcriptional regulator n=1 Tax=Streptomyces sp. NPDC088766 TaxID=3365893 RepID=UPI0038197B7D
MREDVLNAARVMAVEKGWDAVSLAEVAARAEVSRPSIYKAFGNREGLSLALVHREAERFLHGVDRALRQPAGDPPEILAAAVLFALREAAQNPLIAAAVRAAREGTDSLLPYLTTRSDPVVTGAQRLVRSWCRARFPHIDAARADQAADVTVRLALSHIVLPPGTGTLGEAAEVITAAALGALGRPSAPPDLPHVPSPHVTCPNVT